MQQSISLEELQKLWNFTATEEFVSRFNSQNFNFENLAPKEHEEAVSEIERTLERELVVSGSHRKKSWEAGWGQNLIEFAESKNLAAIAPKYFGKYPLIRWKQQFIKPESALMESGLLALLIQSMVETYSNELKNLYEFGCGTGNNLVKIREFNKNLELYGLDWVESSQKIVDLIAKETEDNKLHSAKFDYFNPDETFKIKEDSIVLTVASLEQTGTQFTHFIEYLILQKPKVVIHIEPLWEPLDKTNKLDSLSITYFNKRNYLNGLYLHIEKLNKQGRIEIDRYFRSFVGSFFVDGYSVLIWRPVS
jgi:hypothetical protein